MRFNSGSTNIPTAGTAVQINNTADKVRSLLLKGHPENKNRVWVGRSDVSKTNGYPLEPGEAVGNDFGAAPESFDVWYVAAEVSGDDICWLVTLES